MPLLAALFGSIFTGLIEWFAKYVTKRIALYAATVTALTALTGALLATFSVALLTIKVTLPVTYGTLTAFLPDNLGLCLSTYSACALAKWVYDWNTTLVIEAMKL